MMHQLGTSMGALGAMLPRRWSKPFCSPKIWWSYEALGGVKFSFTLKGFWAWYVYILPSCFSFSFLFFYLAQHSFLFFFFKAVQSTFRLKEMSNSLSQQLEEERKMRATAVQTLTIAGNSNTDLKKRLTAEEQARKSADAALEGAERQVES